MRKTEFMKMKEIDEYDKENEIAKLNVGDKFLYGRNMVNQKQVKKVGEDISYFTIIKKTPNGAEYGSVFDIMEKDKGDVKNE